MNVQSQMYLKVYTSESPLYVSFVLCCCDREDNHKYLTTNYNNIKLSSSLVSFGEKKSPVKKKITCEEPQSLAFPPPEPSPIPS